jgi:hypothetical protein
VTEVGQLVGAVRHLRQHARDHHRQDAADLDLVERAIVEHVHRHASDAAAVKAL